MKFSRAFNKKIELWGVTSVPDGYGGFTTTSQLVTSSWANIKSIQPGKQNNASQFGLITPENSVLFTVKKRNDLVYNVETMFIKYRGVKYTISTEPTNINFTDSTITFIGVAESNKVNET